MKTGVMQPYIFPYIGYFQLINSVDKYVLFDDVQHIKRGWINRNNILVDNNAHRFTIALEGASTTKKINQITVKDDFVVFMKTIQQNYAKAPYFKEVFELLSQICGYKDRNLAYFAANSIQIIMDYVGVETELLYSSDIKSGSKLRAQERILEICKSLGSNHYINAVGGKGLYDKDMFAREGILLNFIETEEITYEQFGASFVPNLSIIDVMMFNDKLSIKKFINAYTLT